MDKFSMYQKWFWIGVVIGFLNGVAGLIYGIALVVEPKHRKEGWVLILWSLVIFILQFALARYLQAKGIIPTPLYVPAAGPESLPMSPQ